VLVSIDSLRTYIALHISTGTNHFIASVFFEKGFAAGIAFTEEGRCHGLFDDMFRFQGVVSSLINYHQPSSQSYSPNRLLGRCAARKGEKEC
jgi:hypothetical protein